MKKITSIIIISLLAFGCSKDFLDRYPTTALVVEQFYQTPADATQAITTIYNSLLIEDWWSQIIFSQIASDECAGGGGSADDPGFQRTDRGMTQINVDANRDTWKYYYGGIYRANIYLEKESLIDWKGKEQLRTYYLTEAKFLRAYFHFLLTREFGEIPALDHTISPAEIPTSKTPAEDMFAFILDDLKYCADNGRSEQFGSITTENWGRANKWAAEAMIARVFLFYTGYYNKPDVKGFTAANAQTYIDDLIKNGGYSLVPKFASLWRVSTYSELCVAGDTINRNLFNANYAGEINPEVVWSIRYVPGSGFGSGLWQRLVGPRGTNIDPYGQGWGGYTVLPITWNWFDSTDTRRDATILNWDKEGLVYDYATNTQAQYTGYNVKKYEIASVNGIPEDLTLGGTDWQSDAVEDYMVVRYADVLLMAAELHLLNGDETALTYLNEVRARAYGNTDHNYSSLSFDNIYAERKLELSCEGIRYWDILRYCKGDFSKLVTALTYVDNNDGGDYSQSTDKESLDVDGNNFAERKGLFQIPQSEIDLMKDVITQNEGYVTQ
jgi:hypothetical protein